MVSPCCSDVFVVFAAENAGSTLQFNELRVLQSPLNNCTVANLKPPVLVGVTITL